MQRRRFIKGIGTVAAAQLVVQRARAGAGPGTGQPEPVTADMARHWFLRSMSCSEALVTILNRGAGIVAVDLEQAAHPLSGGVLHRGHACGMIWGTALAVGARTARNFPEQARGDIAITVMKPVVEAFRKTAGAVNCREITGCDLTRVSGEIRYVTAGKAGLCTRLAARWAPVADDLIEKKLGSIDPAATGPGKDNCAQRSMRQCARALKIEADPQIVSGFAGGLGLMGNVCGALAAGVLALGLKYYQARGRPRDGMLRGALQELGAADGFMKAPERLRAAFQQRFSSLACRDIAGREFASASELSAYCQRGGCSEVIDAVEGMVTSA